MIPTNLTDQLVRDEGEILHVYPDSEGYWTIGSGICIDKRVGCGITHEENLYLLNNRINLAGAAVKANLPWVEETMDPVRANVFINMCFNQGIEHLLGFHDMLRFARGGDFKAAAAAGRDSLWYRQVGDRAKRLMTQLEFGQWQ